MTATIDTDKALDLDRICAAINDEFTEIANLSPIKPTAWTLKRLNELLEKVNLFIVWQ